MEYPQAPVPSCLFDLDGTLIDSVYQHVIAWRAALEDIGIDLSVWRIHRRIGMSGGLFVQALLRETGRTLSPDDIAQLQQAHAVAKRVRTQTSISRGHVSVSSVAVDYVRQVFDHFGDKTVLVIGAGKMGELTLRHLRGLQPQRILVTNRSPEKAQTLAQGCGGQPVAWEKLDDALEALALLCEPVEPPRGELEHIHYFCGNTEVPSDLEERQPQRAQLYKTTASLLRAYAKKTKKGDASAAGVIGALSKGILGR